METIYNIPVYTYMFINMILLHSYYAPHKSWSFLHLDGNESVENPGPALWRTMAPGHSSPIAAEQALVKSNGMFFFADQNGWKTSNLSINFGGQYPSKELTSGNLPEWLGKM